MGSSQSKSSEQMLGMGSLSGRKLRSKSSTSSDSSDESILDQRSRQTSTGSRASSDGGSLFEGQDNLLGKNVDTSCASLSTTFNESAAQEELIESVDEKASRLAEARGVGEALPMEGQASREEENLGRPEIQVEDLSSALTKGVDLDGVEDSELDQQVAQGFEESSPHIVLQASVAAITPTHVVLQSSSDNHANKKLWSIDSVSVPYTHLVYALGSHLPDPLRTEARSKPSGMSWMREMQERVRASQDIVLVGGGALGVEFATDIKSIYPEKHVTLIHSRKQLLPNFDIHVHEAAYARLTELGVELVLGERLALTEGCPRGSTVQGQQEESHDEDVQRPICSSIQAKGEGAQARNEGMCLGDGRKRVKTTGGKEFECDLLLLCTGQQPNSGLMAQLSPTSVDSTTRLVRVHRTLQVKVPNPHGGIAPMPFDPKPPCGDCDCFLDKKAAGATSSGSPAASDEQKEQTSPALDGEQYTDGRLSNVYAIGDVADAFGALNAGYQAWNMADVAAENIIRDIDHEARGDVGVDGHASPTALEKFAPPVNMLKLSLGLGKMIFQGAPPEDDPHGRPLVDVREDAKDLAVEGVWQFMAGMSTEDMYV